MEQDNELLLFDRVNVVRDTINKYGEDNFYISFSGGKDSTLIHYLVDMALPNNKIPRVFINTGIEYNSIVKFVREMAEKDDRFVILKPSQPVKKMLEEHGYPFKSKQHAHDLAVYQRSGMTKTIRKYLGIEKGSNMLHCPKKLMYQFENGGLNFKISDQCCMQMKKKPIHAWELSTGKHIAITGMRNAEGGQRASIKGCILTDKDGKVRRFHPFVKVNDDFEQFMVAKIERERESRILCELYYPPFNFTRTGCRGCPFAIDLAHNLEIMEKYFPVERKACEIIWKPVYDEYRRLGYRLKKNEQLSLLEDLK